MCARARIRVLDGLLGGALSPTGHAAHRGDLLLVTPPGLIGGRRSRRSCGRVRP
ncbi:hypothetical protein [Actinomyces viscosus]|uniref:hypothetical protein n=1 Tax=Actinomyces viscosus TaxID=1656 RepID=UPI0028EAE56C|nr:hypothetical protein [Actinomyces viscosus]